MEEKYTSQILAYLNNQLTKADKIAFEKAMVADKALAEAVRLYEDLYDVHEVIADETLAATIQGANDAYFNKTATAKPIGIDGLERKDRGDKERKSVALKWGLGLAASFLLLLAIGSWWAGRNYSHENLAMNNFNNKQIISFVRSTGDTTNDPFAEGLAALNKYDYETAIVFFTPLVTEVSFKNEAQLYLALAQFKAGDYANAQVNAREVMEKKSQFAPKAKWLLVNALLANGETGAAFQQLLNEMINDDANPYYQKKAQTLQEDLGIF